MSMDNKPKTPDLSAWTQTLDPELGFWSKVGDPGGKPFDPPPERTFEVRRQTDLLLAAAEAGLLAELPVRRTLESLLAAQDDTAGRAGCYRWYYHEAGATDGNAGFFTTLPLLVLRLDHAALLGAAERSLCDRLLENSRRWFARKAEHRNFRYPNAYIGDLVCHYLIEWHLGGSDLGGSDLGGSLDAVCALLEEAAAYYRDEAWGWGEHMSDNYAKVCQCAIGAMLFLEPDLPETARESWKGLVRELIAIDRLYEGGPRVPVIRTYALDRLPTPVEMRPFSDEIGPVSGFSVQDYMRGLKAFFHRKGWTRGFADVAPAHSPVPCFGGALAHARLEERWRMGVLSRYPVMEGLDDQTGWGLAWQTMPFALWSETGDWGFLQWEAEDAGGVTAHPALGRWQKVKSLGTQPPFGKGETFGVPWQDGFLILRRLAEIPAGWSAAVDRFRLFPGDGTGIEENADGRGFLLRLGGAGTTLHIHYLPLRGAPDQGTLGATEDCRTLDHPVDTEAGRGYAALWWIGESSMALEREDGGAAATARINAGGESLVIALDEAEPLEVR